MGAALTAAGGKLHRRLAFWDVFCIATGSMISSGLFVLPGLAYASAGPAVIVAYLLAGVLIVPTVLCQAELASAMPRAGATYMFIERSLGTFPGTFAGLASWFSLALKAAFALVGIGAFARLVYPETPEWVIRALAISFCVVFAALNCLTVKGVGRVQVALVVVLLGVLGVFIAAGVGWGDVSPQRFEPFATHGWRAVLATAGLVFVSFGGLTATADVSGEVDRPGRNVPAGMLAALAIVVALYVASVFIVVGVSTPADNLAEHLTPLSMAGERVMGRPGLLLLSAAAMLAFITTANGGLLQASRSPLAMSHDGLLPKAFQVTSRRFHTPWLSVVVTTGFMIVLIAALAIEDLVRVASTMLLMLYMMVCLAVIIMRSSRLQNYRPQFRSPLQPWLAIAGLAAYVLLLLQMGLVPLVTTGIFALAGLAWWAVYIRPRIQRESALVYAVRRVLAKELYRSELEDELKQIAFERDDVTHDRFDMLIAECPVMDFPDRVSADKMFDRAAEALSERVDMPADKLKEMFTAREEQSSTVIQPGLAIPHIVVPGDKRFELAMARGRQGIEFPGQAEPVRVVFVLVGSVDERNYHLRVLMAIAHVVQESGFVEAWLKADNAQHLRDLVLLSGRKRDVPH